MYQKILVALENALSDESLLPHIAELAHAHKSQLVLLHVADGWAARNYDDLLLAESEEMKEDRAYLESAASRLRDTGLEVSTCLACGNPPSEIVKTAEREHCDLIALASHGHSFLGDLVFGSTINEVRHKASAPLLLVKAAKHP